MSSPAAATVTVTATAAIDDVNAASIFGDEAEVDDVDDSEEELGVDDDSDDDDEEEELAVTAPANDLDFSSPSTSSAEKPPHATANGGGAIAAAVPIHVTPISFAPAPDDDVITTPSLKRQKTTESPSVAVSDDRRPLPAAAAALEDSRRLFQRLWTDDDEIAILQGFLDFTSQRSSATAHHSHHHDTGPFYEQIKTCLQVDFNKSQLVEKLRRLKKKYRNITNRMGSGKDFSFKSPHDQATFEISRKIWGNSNNSRAVDLDYDYQDASAQINNDFERTPRIRRRARKRSISVAAAAGERLAEAPVEVKVVAEGPLPTPITSSVPNVVDETVRSCLSPLFKELLHCAVGGPGVTGLGNGGGLGLNVLPLSVTGNPVNLQKSPVADEKWRKQQILELEVYSKRLELVQEQIKITLEELRSKG